tara:strand:- start:553 stop:804 length:252 start_codon:yes stop_codon:yes gene_type:complete
MKKKLRCSEIHALCKAGNVLHGHSRIDNATRVFGFEDRKLMVKWKNQAEWEYPLDGWEDKKEINSYDITIHSGPTKNPLYKIY